MTNSGVRARMPYGRLLVVEDEELLFRALERIVSRYRPVRHAPSMEKAMVAMRSRTQWSGFLFDLSLGNQAGGGLELLELAQQEHPGVPAAIVTAHLSSRVVNRVASFGAIMLSKPVTEEELLPFLQRVIAREHHFARDFAERLDAVSRGFRFSPREHEILAWFVANGTRDGYLAFTGMALTTFKTHVKHMLAKASAASISELVSLSLRRVIVRKGRSEPPRAAAGVTIAAAPVSPARADTGEPVRAQRSDTDGDG